MEAAACGDAGFLVNAVQPDVIRLAPPLILTAAQADASVTGLDAAVAEVGTLPSGRQRRRCVERRRRPAQDDGVR